MSSSKRGKRGGENFGFRIFPLKVLRSAILTRRLRTAEHGVIPQGFAARSLDDTLECGFLIFAKHPREGGFLISDFFLSFRKKHTQSAIGPGELGGTRGELGGNWGELGGTLSRGIWELGGIYPSFPLISLRS